MALSLYDVSAPVFRQYLAGHSGVLAKAEAHCGAGAASEADIIATRLYEDMQPFPFQIANSINNSAGAVHVLRGQAFERAQGPTTLAEARSAVDAAVAYLDSVQPGDIAIDPDAEVQLKFPGRTMSFTARNYLLTFAYGNFFFHVTTAYDILRMKGVPVGKRDFLGAVPMTVSG
jgi:hypothetical protein